MNTKTGYESNKSWPWRQKAFRRMLKQYYKALRKDFEGDKQQ